MLSGHWSPPHISAPLGIPLSRCMLGTGVRLINFQYNIHLIVLPFFTCFTCRNLTGIRVLKTCNHI